MAGSPASCIGRSVRVLWAEGPVAGLSDGQLLAQYVSGHGEAAEAAFTTLVVRHGPAVRGACRRFLADPNDADDAFQATFLVLVRKAGALRIGDSLGPWLLGVARRVASRARAQAARRDRPLPSPEPAARPGPEPGLGDLRALLGEELGHLPAAYREAVVLCHLEGLTSAEAAGRLGCPPGTVKSRLARARVQLRRRLTRRGLSPSAWFAALPPGPAIVPAGSAGVVPPRVAALADAVIQERLMFKLIAAGLALAVGMSAAVALAWQAPDVSPLADTMGRAATRGTTAPGNAEDAELAILTLEREWRDAIVRCDLEAIDRIMADDCLLTDTGGNTRDKAACLAAYRSGDYSARSYEAIETKVRVYGDTAVVNGLSRWKSGASRDLRITSVYVKRRGVWRCVAWHGTDLGR